jgi:hypothetical protein
MSLFHLGDSYETYIRIVPSAVPRRIESVLRFLQFRNWVEEMAVRVH